MEKSYCGLVSNVGIQIKAILHNPESLQHPSAPDFFILGRCSSQTRFVGTCSGSPTIAYRQTVNRGGSRRARLSCIDVESGCPSGHTSSTKRMGDPTRLGDGPCEQRNTGLSAAGEQERTCVADMRNYGNHQVPMVQTLEN